MVTMIVVRNPYYNILRIQACCLLSVGQNAKQRVQPDAINSLSMLRRLCGLGDVMYSQEWIWVWIPALTSSMMCTRTPA